MHDPNKIMWYDTAACWNTGRIQKSYSSMKFNGEKMGDSWSKGIEYLDTADKAPVGAPDQTVTTVINDYPKGGDGSTVNWGTSLKWGGATIISKDKEFYTNVLKGHIELIEDCDMDC